MAIIKVDDSKSYYLDNTLKENLDILLDGTTQNDDIIIVVDGEERAGKSLIIRQIAFYCAQYLNVSFGANNIHYDLNSYVDFSIENDFYSIVILDEARNVLNRKNSMSKTNKKFTNYISECGKKRQIHILGIPAYHDLDTYIINWRNKLVIHVLKYYEKNTKFKSNYGIKRGEYYVYKNDEYLKKCYQYPYAYPKRYAFTGRFDNIEVLNTEELQKVEDKKDTGMFEKYHSSKEKERLSKYEARWKERFIRVVKAVKENTNLNNDSLSAFAQMSLENFKDAIYKERGKVEDDKDTYINTQV